MSQLASVPEELLRQIIESLAYLPAYSQDLPSDFQVKRVTSQLRSLSLVDKQMRRICLPFLFASLIFSSDCRFSDFENFSVIRELLSKFKYLSCVDLTSVGTLSGELLNTIYNYGSMATVLVAQFSSLPSDIAALDLSKIVVLNGDCFRDPIRADSLASLCIQIITLQVNSFDEEHFQHQIYRGVRTLDLQNHLSSMAWFPVFASNHPLLSRLVLNYGTEYHPSLPFLHSFAEMSRQLGRNKFRLEQLVLTRAPPSSASLSSPAMLFQDWRVSQVTVFIQSSSIETLSLISTSFPNIDSLIIRFRMTRHDEPELDLEYDLDDLVNVFSRFRSLRTIQSTNLFSLVRQPSELTLNSLSTLLGIK
ncbi:hypothetical protein D9757_005302 [Collybiopsis confluens]|uniref:Uncharacterized protein n=1 Tax=Collybiopsis confluens TaxID=2823264 RepID=A0A8H5HW37_9AGAR|nr:hypothetical protein D9757_005302 [Collybiopsis confluens]